MKKRTIQPIVLIFLLFAGTQGLFAQKKAEVPYDEKAENLVALGKKYLNAGSYLDASLTFPMAVQRPFNQKTTVAIYLAGLSFYHLDEAERSLEYFNRLLKDYPASRYREDALYHKGLLGMQNERPSKRDDALYNLLSLHKDTQDGELKSEIESSVKHFLANVWELEALQRNFRLADEIHRPFFVEAECIRYEKNEDGYAALTRINEFEEAGGKLTRYLSELKAKYEGGEIRNLNRINIAVFMSFNLQLLDTARNVPSRSRRALHFLEGMQIAFDSLGKDLGKQVNVRVFDTRGNKERVAAQVDSLDQFRPDIIIGGVRTDVNFLIGQYAERSQAVQIIPRNILDTLIYNRRNVFLAHPSVVTQGKEMARFLVEGEFKKKFLVINDQTYYSDRLSRGFVNQIKEMKDLGVTVVEKRIPWQYELNKESLPSFIRGLKNAGYDALYVPVASEETAGLIISELSYHNVKTEIAGSPDWSRFNIIDPDIKTRFNLKYTTNFYQRNDSTGYADFARTCQYRFGFQPEDYACFGYDIGGFIIQTLKNANALQSLADNFRESSPYLGLHEDISFVGTQGNQRVNIVKFENGKITKVNFYNEKQEFIQVGPEDNPGGR